MRTKRKEQKYYYIEREQYYNDPIVYLCCQKAAHASATLSHAALTASILADLAAQVELPAVPAH